MVCRLDPGTALLENPKALETLLRTWVLVIDRPGNRSLKTLRAKDVAARRILALLLPNPCEELTWQTEALPKLTDKGWLAQV